MFVCFRLRNVSSSNYLFQFAAKTVIVFFFFYLIFFYFISVYLISWCQKMAVSLPSIFSICSRMASLATKKKVNSEPRICMTDHGKLGQSRSAQRECKTSIGCAVMKSRFIPLTVRVLSQWIPHLLYHLSVLAATLSHTTSSPLCVWCSEAWAAVGYNEALWWL